jgi:deazaflavin-dependent oxidoreductase (nitroreductase family)
VPLSGNYVPSSVDHVREQAETFEASGGADARLFLDLPIVVLTSVGAKTGSLRKNPLMRIEHDGTYAVVSSNGGSETHPTWYYNLKKNPHVELQDGSVRHDYLAREVAGEERELWWGRAVAAYPMFTEYTIGLERTLPIFVLTPIDASIEADLIDADPIG